MTTKVFPIPLDEADRNSWGQRLLDAMEQEYRAGGGTAYDMADTAYTLTVGAWAAFSTGLAVVVPPTPRDIQIIWGVHAIVGTGGVGTIATRCAEFTTGVAVERGAGFVSGTFTNGTFDGLQPINGATPPLEPIANTWRLFRIEGAIFRPSGNLAATISESMPAGMSTHARAPWMKAVLL